MHDGRWALKRNEVSQENISVNRSGISISYLRYLADSSAGLIVWGALIFALETARPLFGFQVPLGFSQLSYAAQGALLFFMFLLATPLGLAINAVGWFAFGWVQTGAMKRWLGDSQPWFLAPTYRAFSFSAIKGFYKNEPLYDYLEPVSTLLVIRHPGVNAIYSHVEGIRTFFQNILLISWLALLSEVVNLAAGVSPGGAAVLFLSGAVMFSFILTRLLYVYKALQRLHVAMLLMKTNNAKLRHLSSVDDCIGYL